MRPKTFLFSCALVFTSILILLQFACKKEEDNPSPVKKKYAWAVGTTDSTGYGMILFSPDGGETWQRQGESSSAL
jgi:hypothetical protein